MLALGFGLVVSWPATATQNILYDKVNCTCQGIAMGIMQKTSWNRDQNTGCVELFLIAGIMHLIDSSLQVVWLSVC